MGAVNRSAVSRRGHPTGASRWATGEPGSPVGPAAAPGGSRVGSGFRRSLTFLGDQIPGLVSREPDGASREPDGASRELDPAHGSRKSCRPAPQMKLVPPGQTFLWLHPPMALRLTMPVAADPARDDEPARHQLVWPDDPAGPVAEPSRAAVVTRLAPTERRTCSGSPPILVSVVSPPDGLVLVERPRQAWRPGDT
jgi:hypothetical protein